MCNVALPVNEPGRETITFRRTKYDQSQSRARGRCCPAAAVSLVARAPPVRQVSPPHGQDRQHHAVQRPGLGLRRRSAAPRRHSSRWSTIRAASPATRSTSSPTMTATARRRRSSRCAGWSRRIRSPSCSNTLGTPTNSAIASYVNQKKVPHLFVGYRRRANGATTRSIPGPWASSPSYRTEAQIYAKYILASRSRTRRSGSCIRTTTSVRTIRPVCKDILGRQVGQDRRQGRELRDHRSDDRFAARRACRAAGADVLLVAAIPKFAAQRSARCTTSIGSRALHDQRGDFCRRR